MAENNSTTPVLDQLSLQSVYGNYTPTIPGDVPLTPFKAPNTNLLPTLDGEATPSALSAIENNVLSIPPPKGMTGGSIPRNLAEVTTPRYNVFVPGDFNNEDAYAQGQGLGDKIVNSVGKGLALTGTTFLQSTAGLVNGIVKATSDGRAASFYDNELNRSLDEFNKSLEDTLPNYYTDKEKSANWYSPAKLFTANFFWDGIVKNMGFAAGAALSGVAFTSALKVLPLTSRLFSVGKAAETLAATEQALLTANKVADTYGKVRSLSDKFLGSYNLLNPGGRALVAGLATTGEAGFEAFHNLNDFRNEKIQEWRDTHGGMAPIGSELDAINMEADNIGNSSFMLNTALLSATNYIQFPKILGSSYAAEKGMINGLTKEIGDITTDAAGNFVKVAPTTRFGKVLSTVNKIRPYTFSTSEGFEEGAQYAISVGTKDYYNKKFKGEEYSVLDSLITGVGQTVGTNEGMENVLIGGLSGTLMMARGRYKAAKAKGLNTAEALTAFNKHKLSDFTKETLDSVSRGTVLQEEREKALKQGDVLESKDLEADYIINYLTPRVKYGRYDLISADINDMKKLASTEEGFAQLQADGKALSTDTRAQFLKRLSTFERTAEDVNSLYQSLNLRYGGNPAYTESVINQMIYAASKVSDYDRRIQDVSSSLLLAGVDSSLIVEDVVSGSSDSFNQAIESINELKINSDKKEDLVKQLQDVAELSLRRQKFLQEYDEIKKAPATFKEEVVAPKVKEGETVPTIKVKTKDGEEDIEVGTEYYLGRVVEYDKSGKEIVRFPKLTILGENEDGTIRIKDGDGERNVSKSVLESYKLGKVSDTLSNKKAKFFMENANTIFEFNFGKGKKQRGRLEYSPKDGVLNFVYKDKSGKIREIEVTADQFIPRKGFSSPMISSVGKLTPAQQTSLEDAAKETDERISKKRQVRLDILNTLFNELLDKQEKTKKLINQKQQQVKDIIEELSDLEESIKNAEFDSRSKKALRFKSQGKKALAAAMQLSRTKDQLEAEIAELETQAQELEFNASYVADLAQNIDELPTDSKEFLEELEDQKSLLEDLILETGKNINSISTLIDKVQGALDSAVSYLKSVVDNFKSMYPKVPLALGQEWVDFLKENPNFLKNRPYYKSDLKFVEDLVGQVEDLDITPNERSVAELKSELVKLQKQLVETEKEIKAKDAILSKFQEIADKYKEQKAEEAKIANNDALLQKFLGTHSKEQEVDVTDGGYNPISLKPDNAVLNGSISIDDGKPHQKRANIFGINLPKLKNRDKLRAIEITNKTQAKAGVPGLIQHLIAGTNISPDSVVAVVFVQDDGDGRFSFVDENGGFIQTQDVIESGIYQLRPSEKLTNTYGSMFREPSPGQTKAERDEQIKELTERYAAQREFVLNSPDLQPMKEFTGSFGILEFEQKSDSKGNLVNDFGAQNAIEDTELVTEDDLSEKQLLEVATLNDPTPENGVSFKNAIGRVLLRISGVGLLKMNTSKVGRKKAETIFEVIHKISQNVNSSPEKGVQDSDPLFSWLKSVIYWGIPKNLQTNERKDASYNSVWFDTVEDGSTRLFISGKGQNYTFTPSNLELHKGEIILILENLYHNVSNKNLTGNKKYTEITGISKEGEIQTKAWENYQTYLLSKEGRKVGEVPLTTPILAIKGTPKQNRKGIYFVLEDNIESEVAQKTAPVKSESAPTTKAGYVFDGKTINVYTSPEGNTINFVANEDGSVALKKGGDLPAILQKMKPTAIASNPGKSPEEVLAIVLGNIENRIKASFTTKEAKVDTTPKRTIFDTPAKKEAKVEAPVLPPVTTTENKPRRTIFNMAPKTTKTQDDEVYRLQLAEQAEQFKKEDWTAVEKWLKTNFPNLPVYRVKNAIQATNGRQAWGMLHKGAIYLTQDAETGTAYHEVFEAVWKMMSSKEEQANVLGEFKARKGSFVNKFTGETIKYSEASALDAKEQLAEEFRDYILSGKLPAKPTTGKSFISTLFSEVYNFLKSFFTGENAQTNTANLFSKIGNGYYKDVIPYESQLSLANNGIIDINDAFGDGSSEFRIAYTQKHELMQHMTYSVLSELIKNNASLFGVAKLKKSDIYSWLKNSVLSTDETTPGILQNKIYALRENLEKGIESQESFDKKEQTLNDVYEEVDSNWDAIVAEHIIYLRQFSVEFDENDNIVVENEDKGKGADGHEDALKIDYFRKANPAIKMLLATIPQVEYKEEKVGFRRTSIGGVSTLPLDKTFITLKNKLYNSLDIEDMMLKLREIAKQDPNYRSLYTRLTKLSPGTDTTSSDKDDEINFSKLKEKHDIELLSAFYKSMKAQNADVKIVYILPSGEVEIGDAHLADATRQAKQDMFGDIVSKLKKKHPYISYNTVEKEYNASDVVKKLSLKPGNKDEFIAFLKAIGVEFTKAEVSALQKRGKLKVFEDAVNGVKKGIESISKVKDLNKYTIDLEGRLMGLAALRAELTNPDFESTYFNISGEKTQTYIGTNVMSDFYDVISRVDKLSDLENTPYAYLLTDEFAQNSVVLNSIFNPKTGNKRQGKGEILKTGIVEGIVDGEKRKESTKITTKDRLIEELNLNQKGWFLNLVPGDASIEWMVKLFEDPFILAEDLKLGWNQDNVYNIFKGYFIAELNAAREGRSIAKVEGRETSDLRFFKPILGADLHDKVTRNKTKSAEQVYLDNQKDINSAVKDFIQKEAKDTLVHLKDYGIVKYGESGIEVSALSFAQDGITEENLLIELEASQANYMVANIELHKLVYSDPYFYKDELKRIKNFNSPAQPLLSSKKINEAIHEIYNKTFKKGQLGFTDFLREYLVSATIADVQSFIKDLKGYENWDETDGGGIITMQANRNLRIRAANWNSDEEKQYAHDVAYERMVKAGASEKEIELFEKKNPGVKSAYTPLKPIVRGAKADGKPYNDVVLDKFALTPFSFRILHKMNPESNALKHYQRMQDGGVDYNVFKSGRKVGAGYANPLYNEGDGDSIVSGTYDSAPFLETSDIPFSIISIQTEVPSKDKPEVTQGSQITKLATMDFMDAGVPLDFDEKGEFEDRWVKWTKLTEAQKEKASPLYKLIKYNETLLIERIQHGYDVLLNRLGIQKSDEGFIISDRNKLVETLTSEIYKREVNDNIITAFKAFEAGEVVLEATPAYQQIRNILYSIANKQVVRPKISGGQKVQIPSTLLESTRPVGTKGHFESDILNFYTTEVNKDGVITKVNVAEIMVGRWFKSDLSDTELLKYLNETEEGQKILGGIGFRIPTQKQNSIDVFKIKQFLPAEFGDSVVIPSALVQKVGSDFDIDKLSVYFKNTYTNLKGELKLIPFFGYGEKAKAKFAEMYENGDFLSEKDRKTINKWIRNRKREDRDDAVIALIENIFGEGTYDETYVQEVLDDFLDSNSSEELAQKIVGIKYGQSLENEYIQSLEDLTSHPLNYDKLITPNSAKQLVKLSGEIVKKLGFEEIDYSSVGNMLDRNFMERLRQAFVRGKYAIGIAATSQTNNAQNQRSPITIEYDKLKNQSPDDRKWLGDGIVRFKEFNTLKVDGVEKPTLSVSRNAEKSEEYPKGQLISDIIGMFIDGYVDISKGPWIMELGATPNTASTWLFLIKLGVPVNTVAYFMNQPIIREHLKDIENAGYSWIFNDVIANQLRSKYDSSTKINKDQLPSEDELEKMVGKKELSEKDKAYQLFVFDEFFKYSKLAEQLFHVQQGSNFDTASINDPFLAFKKRVQLEKARGTMISSVDAILDNSFVGKLKDRIFDIRNAFSTILISDKPGSVRNVLETTLLPYTDSNDREFVKTSQKAVFDLFDWAVQTNNAFGAKLQAILLGSEDRSTAAEQIMNFVSSVKADPTHPLYNNYIIGAIKQGRESVQDNKPHNLYIAGKNNKTYDQNNVIYGFHEIKEYLEGQDNLKLYTKLVDLAVLQSGLANSRISFTQLLPYEDFKNIYNETLSMLDKIPNLQKFVELDVFQRNNWNNPDIVTAKKSQWLKLKTPYTDYITGETKSFIKVPEIEFLPKKLQKAIRTKELPQLIQLSKFSQEGREEIVVFSWEKDISKKKKQEMRKKGDYSYIQKGLFKKVYGENGEPLISTYTSKKNKRTYEAFIYKPINAWGDSFRANEFYSTPEQSKIDNGFIKVEVEATDAKIEQAFLSSPTVKIQQNKGSDKIPDCA